MKSQKRKLSAMFIIFLLVTTTISFNASAQDKGSVLGSNFELNPSERDQRDTGESIVINVDSYEPNVVESFLLEKDSVPVYAYLKGYTIGSLIGAKAVKSEPIYGDANVRNIIVLEADENQFVRFVHHMPPAQKKLSLNNLGVVQIMLERIQSEKNVPDNIIVNLTARVTFDRQSGIFGFGSQDLRLEESRNENEWLGNMGSKYGYLISPDLSISDSRRAIEKTAIADTVKKASEKIRDILSGRNKGDLIYGGRTSIRSLANPEAATYDDSFWGGNGYIRLSRVKSSSADFVIYDRGLNIIGRESLTKDETSKVIKFPDRLAGVDRFRIQLLDVVDPTENSARVEINNGGSIETKILTEGSRIYPESRWSVKEIKRESKDGLVIESVILEDDSREQAQIRKDYGDASSFNELKLPDIGNIEANPNDDFKTKLNPLKLKFDIFEEDGGYPNAFNIIPSDLKFKKGGKIDWKQGDYFLSKLTELAELADASVLVDNNKIMIRANNIGDICNNEDYLSDEEITNAFNKNEKKKIYCSSIREYEDVISLFKDERKNNILYSDEVKIKTAKAYLELSNLNNVDTLIAKSKALSVLDSISEKEKFSEYKTLKEEVSDINVKNKDVDLLENGEVVSLKLISINIGKEKKGAEVYLSINSGKPEKYNVGDYLYKTAPKKEKIDWYIESLEDSGVVFSGIINDNQNKIKDTVRISTGKDSILKLSDKETLKVKVVDVNFNKEVYARILPGVDDAYSESNFLVRIPIEKRPFDFNPEKIGKRIQKTEEKIKKLTSIIDKLEKLVESWKKLCLATFAFLTIKNSFLGGFSKNEARKIVVSGENGWEKYCNDAVNNKAYKSVDECMIKNNKYITQDINAAKNAVKETNQAMKKRAKERENAKGKPIDVNVPGSEIDFNAINAYQKETGEFIVGADEERDLRYLISLKKGCHDRSSLDLPGKEKYKGAIDCEGLSQKLEKMQRDYKLKNEKYKLVNDFVKAGSEYRTNIEASVSKFGRKVENADLVAIRRAAEFDAERVLHYKEEANKKGNALLGKLTKIDPRDQDYTHWLDYKGTPYQIKKDSNKYKIKSPPEWMKKIFNDDKNVYVNEDINTISGFQAPMLIEAGKGSYVVFDGKVIPVSSSNEATINDLKVKLNPSNQFNIDLNMRYTYAAGAAAEYYEDGKPFCIPIKNGDYVRVNDYNKLNNPSNYDILNVGPDGLLCTSDDILRFHYSLLQQDPSYRPYLIDAERAIRKATNIPEGGVLSIDGKTFGKSSRRAAALGNEVKPSCYDVMDPRSCQIMFNVCDPVMCPPSRFNLEGRWQLPPGQSVVQTGIIGSLFLGWPIITAQQPIPKVCMTGILAGLKNIRSLLQGYVRCLSVAKTEGKSVGICDKIRSIGICELLWKEAIAIFKIQGGFVSLISEKVFKETAGGGEYLTFQDSLKNVENSVNFFTTEYASTSFTAFQGRSMQDIGADICRSAIFGRFPGIGDFVDQLAKPESPPQFTAFFSEFTHDEANKESRYDVYYHLYAGDDANVKYPLKYSVYLRNKFGDFFYVTEECNKRSSAVDKNDFRDISTHCISAQGLDEICVDINGVIECGFGKVTSSFAIDYMNDFIVKEEANRKINSVRDCVAENPRLSPFFTDVVSKVPLPGELSLANTGIVRVCSINNPGAINSESKYWQPVGECGQDKEKIDSGLCWIDLRSVSLNDANKIKSLSRDLESKGIALEEKSLKFTPIEDNEAEKILNTIIETTKKGEEIKAEDWQKQIIELRKLTKYSTNPQIKVKALILIGDLLSNLAGQSKKTATAAPSSEPENSLQKLKDYIAEIKKINFDNIKFDDINYISNMLNYLYKDIGSKSISEDLKKEKDLLLLFLEYEKQRKLKEEKFDKIFKEIDEKIKEIEEGKINRMKINNIKNDFETAYKKAFEEFKTFQKGIEQEDDIAVLFINSHSRNYLDNFEKELNKKYEEKINYLDSLVNEE